MYSFILYGFLIILSINLILVLLLVLFGFYRKLKSKAPKKTHGHNAPLTKFVIIFNLFGEFFHAVLKRPFVQISKKDLLKYYLHENVEVELLGDTASESHLGAEYLSKEINDPNNMITPIGKMAFKSFIDSVSINRKNVLNYALKNRDDFKEITKPLFIIGLPRTGSTLLLNLLSCDPKTRTLRNWEMFMSIPPPEKETYFTDKRIKTLEKVHKGVSFIQPDFYKEFFKIHYYNVTALEEEYMVMLPMFVLLAHQIFFDLEGEYNTWLMDQEKKQFLYNYLYLFLQTMQLNYEPESHWSLKAPIHSLYPERLLERFPDGNFIVTHRSLNNVVPSWIKLYYYSLSYYFNEQDVKSRSYPGDRFKKAGLHCLKEMTKRVMKAREKDIVNEEQFYDCYYPNFIENPINMVKSIYEHFGYDYTDEFEENMKNYLSNNKQHKYGRVDYSLEEFNLTEDDLSDIFQDYLSVHGDHI